MLDGLWVLLALLALVENVEVSINIYQQTRELARYLHMQHVYSKLD